MAETDALEKTKIAILGGGVGAMTAAFALTERTGWDERYEITVYQMGWRLGGKGASGRNREVADRIEEHGLHIWFGFYDNAFAMMKAAYDRCNELGLAPDSPFRSWSDTFKPRDLLTAMELIDDRWIPWDITYPVRPGQPGDGSPTLGPWDYVRLVLDWMVAWFEREGGHTALTAWHEVDAGMEHLADWVREALVDAVGIVEAGLGLPGGPAPASARSDLHRAHALARAMPDDPNDHNARHQQVLIWLLDRFLRQLDDQVGAEMERDNELRRFHTLMDLAVAVVRGLIADGVFYDGFDAIDRHDAREWLRRHGCRSADSCLIRGTYDLVFAYIDGDLGRADFAAGTALRAVLRILFTYHGSIVYEMQAGMGDTVFAPLYLLLQHRGVKFEFFHRVTNLGLSDDGAHVEAIALDVQATVKPEVVRARGGYGPLYDVKGLPCWPDRPLYDQLVEGEAIEQGRLDLESAWCGQCVGKKTLRRGQDFDLVICGISLGGLKYVAGELIAARPRWRDMVEKIPTVQTQAFQIWLNRSSHELGWDAPERAIVGAYTEPIDTWADMSHLLVRETWPAALGVRDVSYYCAAMAGPAWPPLDQPGFPAEEACRARQTALDFLRTKMTTLWPNAAGAAAPGEPVDFDWNLLIDPRGEAGEARFDAQHWRANVDPSERYVLSIHDTVSYRLRPDDSGFANLYLAGDWTYNGINLGCVEAAAMSGLYAARAICGYPRVIYGDEGRPAGAAAGDGAPSPASPRPQPEVAARGADER